MANTYIGIHQSYTPEHTETVPLNLSVDTNIFQSKIGRPSSYTFSKPTVGSTRAFTEDSSAGIWDGGICTKMSSTSVCKIFQNVSGRSVDVSLTLSSAFDSRLRYLVLEVWDSSRRTVVGVLKAYNVALTPNATYSGTVGADQFLVIAMQATKAGTYAYGGVASATSPVVVPAKPEGNYARHIKNYYLGVDNVSHFVKKIYIGIGNVAKRIFNKTSYLAELDEATVLLSDAYGTNTGLLDYRNQRLVIEKYTDSIFNGEYNILSAGNYRTPYMLVCSASLIRMNNLDDVLAYGHLKKNSGLINGYVVYPGGRSTVNERISESITYYDRGLTQHIHSGTVVAVIPYQSRCTDEFMIAMNPSIKNQYILNKFLVLSTVSLGTGYTYEGSAVVGNKVVLVYRNVMISLDSSGTVSTIASSIPSTYCFSIAKDYAVVATNSNAKVFNKAFTSTSISGFSIEGNSIIELPSLTVMYASGSERTVVTEINDDLTINNHSKNTNVYYSFNSNGCALNNKYLLFDATVTNLSTQTSVIDTSLRTMFYQDYK